MIIVRYNIPGETTTLYDSSIHHKFRGTLYFQSPPSSPTDSPTLIFRKIALACFTLSLVGWYLLFAPVAIAAVQSHFIKPTQNQNIIHPVTPTSNEFNLHIDAINLDSEIIPNVDPNSEDEYMVDLKLGVAQAKGSYLPGQKGTIVLFAHSTDSIENIAEYNAKFYGVKDLKNDDIITIHYHGKTYNYQIYDKQVIDPQDVGVIQNSTADLILETCYPPGTNWKRLITFAKQISD